MKKIPKIFLSSVMLLFMSNSLYAVTEAYNEQGTSYSYQCSPEQEIETITPLENIDKSKTVILTGNSLNNDYDYYKFHIAKSGKLKIDVRSLNESESNYRVAVGSHCNYDDIYTYQKAVTHDIPIIDVNAGDNIYILFKEFGSSGDEYEATFQYQTFSPISEDGTGAGPVQGETIGYVENITLTNTDKTGNIYLVDDNKIECPLAQYSTIEEALVDLEGSNGGTIVLCDGTYQAPTTVIDGATVSGSINNLTITSNSSRDNTIVNGQLNINNISNLKVSHITMNSTKRILNLNNIDGLIVNDIRANAENENIYSENTNNGFLIENSEFNSNNANAISISGISSTMSSIDNVKVGISRNKDEQTAVNGIVVKENNTIITNATIYSHKSGIQLIEAPNSKIIDTEIYNNTTNAIYIENSSNVEIRNSRYIANSIYGIEAINSQNLKVTDSMLEALSAETLYLSNSDGAYIQNNCMISSKLTYDVKILEDMSIATFDNGVKGNFYKNANYVDNNFDNINDYPFYIVTNKNKTYVDNYPQLTCNMEWQTDSTVASYLETLTDIDTDENIVADNAIFGTPTKVQAYTKNSTFSGVVDVNEKVNLLIIADESGSMYDPKYGGEVTLPDGTVTTKLQVTEDAIKSLITTYAKIADVHYNIIGFSSDIDQYTDWQSETVTVPDLNKGGATNYYAALSKAIDTALDPQNLPQAEKTIVYFLSDGEITVSESEFYSPSFQDSWYNSVVLNPDVYRTYVYGILFNGADLDAVSITEEGYKTPNPIIINYPEDISKELLANLSTVIEYSLVDDYNGAYGIDKQTGEIYVKDSTKLDFNTNPVTTVRVLATDIVNNISIEGNFTITLKEGPYIDPNSLTCDMFSDAVQVRSVNCNAGEGINWNGEAIIKSNPDNNLNTCAIDIPTTISENVLTCETEQCIQATTSAKEVVINYDVIPELATLYSNPTSSTVKTKVKQAVTTKYFNELDMATIDRGGLTIKGDKTLKINKVRFTRNSTLNLERSQLQDLLIGSVGYDWGGENNTFNAVKNFNDIKIKTYLIDKEDQTVNLTSSNSINIEEMVLGQGTTLNIETKLLKLDTLELTNTGSGDSVINIKADYININSISTGQNVKLNIEPLNNPTVMFIANDINMGSNSIMELSSGEYYITSTLDIKGLSDGKTLWAKDENQQINMYINSSFEFKEEKQFNVINDTASNQFGSNPPENFRLYVNGDVLINENAIVNALIYSEGTVNIEQNSQVKGAISASTAINLYKGAEVTYTPGIVEAGYGACSIVASPKPSVSFFEAWDSVQPITNRVIYQKKVGEPFTLSIASLTADNSGSSNVEFNMWLQDVPTGEIVSPKTHFVQKIDDISNIDYKIPTKAYKEVRPTFEICSDYDNIKYTLYDFSSCSTSCSTDLQVTVDNPCMRKVQAKQAFSVVPDNLKIEVFDKTTNDLLDNDTDTTNGKTYVAGENFKIKVTALAIDGTTVVENWNEPFKIESLKAFTEMKNDGEIVEDKTTFSTDTLEFVNGKLEFEGYYNEVGIAKIKITPNTDFGVIDYDVNKPEAHYVTGEEITIGRFIPESFYIDDINLKKVEGNNNITAACKYNYLNKTGANLTKYYYAINVSARNKLGEVTENYMPVFSKNTTVAMKVNWVNIGDSDSSGFTNVYKIISSSEWKDGIYSTPTGEELVANVDILEMLGVDRKTTIEPFKVDLGNENNIFVNNISVSDSEVSKTVDLESRTFDVSVSQTPSLYYVYGRINPTNNVSTPNGDVKINLYYEIYADTNKALLETALNDTTLVESVNNAKWWRNEKHMNCDIKQADDLSITFNVPNTNVKSIDLTNADKDVITIENNVTPRPFETVGTIDLSATTDTYLLHIPYSNKEEVRFNVKFVGNRTTNITDNDVANNSASTTANQYRFIK